MEKNKLGLAVLAIVGLLLVVSVFSASSSVSSALLSLVDTVKTRLEALGATPGTTFSGNFFSIGGVEKYATKTWTATSSVVCSVRNPWSNTAGRGTSTVDQIIVNTPSGFAGAYNYSISTSSTAYGSTTLAWLPERAVAATAADNFAWVPRVATSSLANALLWNNGEVSNPFVLDGGAYLNVRIASTTPGLGLLSGGSCEVELTKFGKY